MDNLLAIYPTARKAEEVLKQQSRLGCRLGHKVLTFPQLIDGLYRDCLERRPVLSPVAERLALEEALQQASCNGPTPFARSPGVLDHLLGLIREFKSAALQPDDLRQACRELNRAQGGRVSALAQVFSEYQTLLDSRGLADRHDRERQVLSMLERAEPGSPRPRMLDGVDQLLVAEIYDFTLLQFMIVTSLIRLIGDARLTIQAEPHRIDSFRFPDLTWNRFVEDESIADQVLPLFIRREGRPGRLGFVLRHLFDGAHAEVPPSPDDTIEIVEAPDRYREVEEAARAIRRAFERPPSERIEPRRIALVARDLTPYAEYLESVFRRYRIPLSLYRWGPPISSAAANLIIDTLRLPLGGYRSQAIERLLTSAQLSIRATRDRWLLNKSRYIDRAARPLADCLEDYRRLVAAKLESATDTEGRRTAERELTSVTAGARRLRKLTDLLESLERPGTIAEHVRRLGDVLEQLNFDPLVATDANNLGRRGAPGQAWEVLTELADAARLVGAERALSLEEFASLAAEVLAQPPIDEHPQPSAQAVQAFSVLDARGLDFDLVFLLGLEDGGFPRYRSEDPILSDELRVALNPLLTARIQARLGIGAPGALRKILRTSNQRNSEDRFLFFLALSMPERQIVLSYPRADKQGNPYLPSPFVDEVLRLLDHPARPSMRRYANEGFVTELDDCFEQASFLSWSAARSALGRPEAAALAERARLSSIERRIEVERGRERYLAIPTREERASAQSHPERLAVVDDYSGRVQASSRLRDLLLGQPGSPRPWTASRLDQLGACGFKFFASHVLKLGEEEEIDYEPSAREFGGLAHEVLRDLFSRPLDFRDPERALAQAREFLAAYRPAAEARAMAREAVLFELKWRDVERIVEELVELLCDESRAAAFNQKPLLEAPFEFVLRGPSASAGGAAIDLVLRGQLDRLDFNRNQNGLVDRIRVCDYKTSRTPDSYADMLSDEAFGATAFQLPVYLMVGLERFRGEIAPGLALEAGYLVLRHRDKRKQKAVDVALVQTDPEVRTAMAERGEASIADNIIALANSALRGEFDVDPRRCDEFCPYRRLCRYHKRLGV